MDRSKSNKRFMQYQRVIFQGWAVFILGTFYLQFLQRSGRKSLSWFFNNVGFLIKNIPFARKKAEMYLTKAIRLARETGARGLLGQPCLQLGLLFKLKGQKEKAKEQLLEAVHVFTECEYEVYLKQAQEQLDSLT